MITNYTPKGPPPANKQLAGATTNRKHEMRPSESKRIPTGWFSVDRKLLESDLWLSEPFTRAQAWIDLVGFARFEPGHIRIKGIRVDLARGQVGLSEVSLGKRWRWSRGKVRRYLKELEYDQRIIQQKTNVTTLITIVNYDIYQTCSTTNRTTNGAASGTADRTTNETQNNKGNNSNNENTSSWAVGEEEEVLRMLVERGVSKSQAAVDAAKARGTLANSIKSLVAEFDGKPGAWDAGALYRRVSGELSEWPPESSKYCREKSRDSDHHRAERLRSEARMAIAAKAQERERAEHLDDQLGSRADAMCKADKDALIREFTWIQDLRFLKSYDRRVSLLEAIDVQTLSSVKSSRNGSIRVDHKTQPLQCTM